LPMHTHVHMYLAYAHARSYVSCLCTRTFICILPMHTHVHMYLTSAHARSYVSYLCTRTFICILPMHKHVHMYLDTHPPIHIHLCIIHLYPDVYHPPIPIYQQYLTYTLIPIHTHGCVSSTHTHPPIHIYQQYLTYIRLFRVYIRHF